MEIKLYKTKNCLVYRAITEIEGFEEMISNVRKQTHLLSRSRSLYLCYSSHLAQMALHFRKLPICLDEQEIKGYLFFQLEKRNFLSESYFKFAVHSLRFLFKLYGMEEKKLLLPVLRSEKKLPIVLSKNEMARLINQPKLLKHRILIGLMYGCGLRISEAVKLRLDDIDLDRATVHIRRSKGRKDRYVPMPFNLIREFEFYVSTFGITNELFPTYRSFVESECLTNSGITFAIKSAARKSGIIKRISAHTLRHTYATHLLEDGLDILSIRDLLGHSRIETTMRYLHIAQVNKKNKFSPLDKLEGVSVLDGIQCKLFLEY